MVIAGLTSAAGYYFGQWWLWIPAGILWCALTFLGGSLGIVSGVLAAIGATVAWVYGYLGYEFWFVVVGCALGSMLARISRPPNRGTVDRFRRTR
jgi:membrane protein implicated in regulation of membrane protease activity